MSLERRTKGFEGIRFNQAHRSMLQRGRFAGRCNYIPRMRNSQRNKLSKVRSYHGEIRNMLTSYPCPKSFSISGHKVILASSASKGGRCRDCIVFIESVLLLGDVLCGFKTYGPTPSMALLDNPKGGTFAVNGRVYNFLEASEKCQKIQHTLSPSSANRIPRLPTNFMKDPGASKTLVTFSSDIEANLKSDRNFASMQS